MAAGQNVDSVTWDEAIDDLAPIDAHSSQMARTTHYNFCNQPNGCVLKKFLRTFLSVMKRLPVDFLHDVFGEDEFLTLLADMGKRLLCFSVFYSP